MLGFWDERTGGVLESEAFQNSKSGACGLWEICKAGSQLERPLLAG